MGDFRNHATLDAHCATSSYIEGCTPTQKDVAVFQAIAKPGPKFPHAARWYKHMASFSAFKMSNLPGIVEQLASTKEAKGVPSEPTKEKKEKPAKEPKEPKVLARTATYSCQCSIAALAPCGARRRTVSHGSSFECAW